MKKGSVLLRPGFFKVRFGLFIVLISLLLFLRYCDFGRFISLEEIRTQKDYLHQLMDAHYLFAVVSYICLYTTVVALFLPLAAVLTMAGGFFFGVGMGALYAVTGATLGALVSFLLVRHLIGNAIQNRYQDQLKVFNAQMRAHGTSFLLSIHFVAVIPFFVINVCAGLTQVSLWTFLWTTALGILPGCFVYSYAGQQLNTITKVSDILSPGIVLAFTLLALLALIPFVVKWWQRSVK